MAEDQQPLIGSHTSNDVQHVTMYIMHNTAVWTYQPRILLLAAQQIPKQGVHILYS